MCHHCDTGCALDCAPVLLYPHAAYYRLYTRDTRGGFPRSLVATHRVRVASALMLEIHPIYSIKPCPRHVKIVTSTANRSQTLGERRGSGSRRASGSRWTASLSSSAR